MGVESAEQGIGSRTGNRSGEHDRRQTDSRRKGNNKWIVMYNSVLVSLIGSLSLRCECLHEWSSACVLHTYRSYHNHYFTGFEIFRNYVRDELSSFSTRRSGRFFFSGWDIERAVARRTETRCICI